MDALDALIAAGIVQILPVGFDKEKREAAYDAIKAAGCTICGKDNLDDELCFNCRSLGECVNCCGCEEGEGDDE